ncbi:MAG: helix-turn-helix transcriptional regulator [Kiritimatiellae bacterium]|nr:helix-turn-helix transcriptional regulator [Kiritimatiellia bacterium]
MKKRATPLNYVFTVELAGKIELEKGGRLESHRIDCDTFDLLHATQGSGRITLNGRDHLLRKGDCMFLFPGECFEASVAEGGAARFERTWIHFNAFSLPLMLPKTDRRGLFPFRFFNARNTPAVTTLCLKIVKEFHADLDWSQALCTAYMTELIATILRERPLLKDTGYPAQVLKNISRLAEVRHFIEQNFERKLSQQDLVHASGLSKNYFSSLFKRYTGYTPYHYYCRRKIDRAKELLIEGQLTVSEIGYRLGFEDMHYFSNTFKKWTGVSPTGYLRQIHVEEAL